MVQSDAEATVRFAVADAIIGNIHHTNLDATEVEFVVGVVVEGLFDYATRWAAKAYADELDERSRNAGQRLDRS